jgi:hypothetical protein
MRKAVVGIVLCAALIFCMSGPASAIMINVNVGGERVVYDTITDLYWYPLLENFLGMTRAEQMAAIDSLAYAGSSDWRMADFMETTALKWSMSETATVQVLPTTFEALGVEDTGIRTLSSPNLAWVVDSTQFFTPTNGEGFEVFGMPTLVFNGRYDGLGWVNDFVTPLRMDYGDDHWMAHNFMTPDAPEGYYLTMMFNSDGHPVGDDVTYRGEGIMNWGGISAWAVTCEVPEALPLILIGIGLVGLAGLRRKFKN